MKTESVLPDVTIQISSEPVLTVPRTLGTQLGVRKGQRVSIQVRNGTLRIRKHTTRQSPNGSRQRLAPRAKRTAKLMDWAGYIQGKSGKVINVEELMSHHGYEQLERPDRAGY
jgi:antitoxin component of MazEF toxin-antitoxin module